MTICLLIGVIICTKPGEFSLELLGFEGGWSSYILACSIVDSLKAT